MVRLAGRVGAGNGTGGWNASEPKFMLKNKNPYIYQYAGTFCETAVE